MKRQETIRVLTRILQQKESEMVSLQASIDGLRIAIHEVECVYDDAITTPQQGTFKQTITNAMYDILREHGPLHRNTILGKIQERGLHIGGGVSTVGSYLSTDERFKNVGKGKWALTGPPMEPMPINEMVNNLLSTSA